MPVEHSPQQGRSSGSKRVEREADAELRYGALNNSELSAIQALQGRGAIDYSVSDESESSSDSVHRGDLTEGDLFQAADVLHTLPCTPDSLYGYEHNDEGSPCDGYDPYDVDRAGPISVDDFINTAYEMEIARRSSGGSRYSQLSRQHGYISSSGGSRNTESAASPAPAAGATRWASVEVDDASDLSSHLFGGQSEIVSKEGIHSPYSHTQRNSPSRDTRSINQSNQEFLQADLNHIEFEDADDLSLVEDILNR